MDLANILLAFFDPLIFSALGVNIKEIEFERPIALYLILLPLIWFFLLQNIFKIQKNANIFIPFKHLEDLQNKSHRKNLTYKTLFVFLIWSLMIIAISGPIKVDNNRFTEKNGYRISLVIDTSLSMNALDFSKSRNELKTRLDVIKEVVTEFINKKNNDLFALITFGDYPVLQSPMTSDQSTIAELLKQSHIGEYGNSTAIGDALALAVDSLKPYKKSRVIILLTDGANSSGIYSPEIIAQIARNNNIPIYTIGIGKDDKVPFLVGNNQVSYQYLPLDEKALINISEISNGKYFKVENMKDLRKVYNDISKLTKIKIKNYDNIQITYYHFEILLTMLLMLISAHLIKLLRRA
ncbi:VWA domain-containing protein [Rickettsiales bacterium]|nr:VWA domain-containing protein [Rickettsiales bacterium]